MDDDLPPSYNSLVYEQSIRRRIRDEPGQESNGEDNRPSISDITSTRSSPPLLRRSSVDSCGHNRSKEVARKLSRGESLRDDQRRRDSLRQESSRRDSLKNFGKEDLRRSSRQETITAFSDSSEDLQIERPAGLWNRFKKGLTDFAMFVISILD